MFNLAITLLSLAPIVVNEPSDPYPEGRTKLQKAIVRVVKNAPTVEDTRPPLLLRDLLDIDADVPNRSLANMTYRLDMAGANVDPLARALFLHRCVARPISFTTYAQCIGDYRRLDGAATTARAGELAQDPVARKIADTKLPPVLAFIHRRFADFEKAHEGEEELKATRDAALAAFAAWDTEVQAPLATAWEEMRRVEELELLQEEQSFELGKAPDARFAGCEQRIAPAFEQVVKAADRATLLPSLANDPKLNIPLEALHLCKRATGRDFAAAGFMGFGTNMQALSRGAPMLRGPRSAAVMAAASANKAISLRNLDLFSVGRSAGHRAHWLWTSRPTDSWDGVLAKVVRQGASTRLEFRQELLPNKVYRCSGSNRVTGVYLLGRSVGVERDVSCGFYEDGTFFDVRPPPLIIPTDRAAGLVVGARVHLAVQGAPGPRVDSGAGALLDGNPVHEKRDMTPVRVDDPFVVTAYSPKNPKEPLVLLGIDLGAGGSTPAP